ncbi:MAG TPA: NAD-dependent succinate-semialdehyde dehydrogenase [Flavobacteriaceae bacterium]|nr:NAD-dependent succinate-semialdehyde dehydrogenase [Flavobacteriaceae bacterium]MCB9213212.1 NAD-dependent succinate-semialdehyde dehydrogenase [Alteromonas sp.]HPF10116.1 NAD-dependent succinate-semialdehyde dehydrogenase [Flavobacteriaceae bacterium]HQU22237.1 NAD-dependent succinate-semialdehyde dehydrogenase [Flavobacteriaceae bacterium]HQU66118.1 NAD-dependent succinate-semialdehyde dehydrogenase [Flavobacteriaceae bacterium]
MDHALSINPYTGKTVASYERHNPKEVAAAIKKSHQQFQVWKNTSFQARKSHIANIATTLRSQKEQYALLMTEEMGKPISQAVAEIEKCAWLCDYYAENAEAQLQDIFVPTDAFSSYVRHEPLGVVLSIMPWNYPFWQVFRFAIPALMAGNVGLLKHASNVFGCALAIEACFRDAGLPEYCFKSLLIGSNQVEGVLQNPLVKAVTLTGSGPAGGAVAAAAGKQIKKSVLELGGSNAMIVMDDCDMEKTLDICVQARFQNTGQSCIAGKRLLLAQSIHDQFLERLVQKVKKLKAGDPTSKSTYIGPMARVDLAKELELQVQQTLALGAKLEIGGKRIDAFYEPTVVSGVTPEMPMFQEETFGPALCVTSFRHLDEAVSLSNHSRYGLGVSLFTRNIEQAMALVPRFEEGAVFVNELVKSDPRLPFGGIKESGYGRELSAQGIKEFVNVKTVYINQ